MSEQEQIDAFFAGGLHAVVGASRDRSKYGNMVLRAYVRNNRPAYPVNPHCDSVEGLQAYPDLASLPEPVHGLSIITSPAVTESIVAEAGRLGIKHVWMQPGAESEKAVALAEEFQMNLLWGGPCILVLFNRMLPQ